MSQLASEFACLRAFPKICVTEASRKNQAMGFTSPVPVLLMCPYGMASLLPVHVAQGMAKWVGVSLCGPGAVWHSGFGP